jgi:Spy/CpxP family protein refolding chaperone
MNVFRKTLVTGLTVIGMGVASYAVQAQQPPAPPAPAAQQQGAAKPDHAQRAEHMRERMAKRQAELHDKLKLTPQQEPAWNTFTTAMKPAQRPARPERAEWEKMSAPQRMEHRLERMKQAETEMGRRLETVKAFYAVLTPEQQKVFNDSFARGPGGHRGHHGHHGSR